MSEHPRERIGFIGLGRMGSRMAARLLDAGYALSVFDVIPERAAPLAARGARVASSPRLSAALMLKDLRLLGDLAAATTTPVPVTAAAQQLFAATTAPGWGELDRAAVLLLLERLAGVPSDSAEPAP